MTFPAAWTRIRVTGKYLLADGTPAQGHVVFSSPQIVLVDDTIVLPVDYVAQLDVDGAIAIDLPATNDPDVTPSGWAWRVNECIEGASGRRYAIAVDAASGAYMFDAPITAQKITAGAGRTGEYKYIDLNVATFTNS